MTFFTLAPQDRDMGELRELLKPHIKREELELEGMVDSGEAYKVSFEGSAPQLYITLGLEPKNVIIREYAPVEF